MSDAVLYSNRTESLYTRLGASVVSAFYAWTEMASYSRGSEHLGL
jgi:hypothetical protein